MADSTIQALARYLAIGDAQKQAIAAEDPYTEGAKIGSDLLGAIASPEASRFSTKDRIVGALLSGGVGGLFGGLSSNYQGRAQSAYEGVIANALNGGTTERPSVLSPSLFSDAKNQASLFKIQNMLSNQEAERDFKNDIRKAVITQGLQGEQGAYQELLKSDPKVRRMAAEQLLEANRQKAAQAIAHRAGVEEPGPVADPEQYGAMLELQQPSLFKPVAAPANEARGVEGTLLDQFNREHERLVEAGVPDPQAAVTARQFMDSKREQLERQYKAIEEADKSAKDLTMLSGRAALALQDVGYTGKGGELMQGLAGILGYVSDNQEKKFTAGQELEALQSDIVAEGGKAFKGPMSDRDVQILLRRGFELSKTGAANQEVLNKINYVAGIQRGYVEFMRNEQARGTDISEAQAKWDQIAFANPYVIKSKSGQYMPNPSWQTAMDSIVAGGGTLQGSLDAIEHGTDTPTAPTAPTMKASDLIAQGYVKTSQGWVRKQ